MDSLEDLTKSQNGKPGFFKHVFNFNEESKIKFKLNSKFRITFYAV